MKVKHEGIETSTTGVVAVFGGGHRVQLIQSSLGIIEWDTHISNSDPSIPATLVIDSCQIYHFYNVKHGFNFNLLCPNSLLYYKKILYHRLYFLHTLQFYNVMQTVSIGVVTSKELAILSLKSGRLESTHALPQGSF